MPNNALQSLLLISMVSNPYDNGPRTNVLDTQTLWLPPVCILFGNQPGSFHIKDMPRLHFHYQEQVQPFILPEQPTCCMLFPRWMPFVSSPTQTGSSWQKKLAMQPSPQIFLWKLPSTAYSGWGYQCHILETEEAYKMRNTLIAPKGWGTSHQLYPKNTTVQTLFITNPQISLLQSNNKLSNISARL